VAFGLAALLLPFISRPAALTAAAGALVFNALLLPRLGARAWFREEERGLGYSPGMLAYPASVFVLLLVCELPVAAAVWALMAFGDGCAGAMGTWLGGPVLPWNRSKTWAGLAGFLLGGTPAAAGMYAWCAPGAPAGALLACGGAALVAALVESYPIRFTDNVSVPLVAAPVLHCLLAADPARLGAVAASTWAVAAACNLALALAAARMRSLDRSGATAAFLVGVAVWIGAGWQGYCLLLAFFVLGSAATRLGYEAKARLGVAQAQHGARSARNVMANGSVAAFAAVMVAAGDTPAAFRAAFAAAVAAAGSDTLSSEVGEWLGSRTYRITTLRPCPAGEDGGVSVEGSLAGLAGAMLVAGLGWALGFLPPAAAGITVLGGVLGSAVDSLLGDNLERHGWLDNEAVNFACTLTGALTGYWLA
jgi:uncharacterized protein (TIGR00297 family)